MEEKIALNAKEASKLLGVSLPVMYDIMKTDGFPCVKFGRRNLIPKESLMNWLDDQARHGNIYAR